VGYKVRFGDHTGPDTFIKVMTDGILLAETQGDPWLEQYDTLIIDEAHERSLNIDFLLGYLRRLLPKRPDLKVIITSATIDPDRFARHFASGTAAVPRPAPVIEVSGRTYPVETRYRPLASDDPDDRERDQEEAILAAVDELASIDPRGGGDVLIFLAGEREIRQTAEALRKHHPAGTEILPLYARLSAQEQMRVFQPHTGRRLVLATNVAETSLTVPGIKYVVDPGYARISRYNPRTKVQRLPIEAVSQASADQRKGRCGRVQAGVCIRLYAEDDFKARPRFTDPEILRTNLASIILQMKALRLGAVEEFPFVEPPDSRMIRDGYETLHELGAIDTEQRLTRTGSQLAKLPIDPRIGRMILAASGEGALREVLVIAAALSIQDPRERPMNAQDAADQAHARFRDENSDFVALLNLWNEYQKQSEHLSGSKLRKWCQQNFVSFIRMREWEDIHQQLHALVADMGFHENPADKPADYASVHRSLLTGLLSNIGQRSETFEYHGTRGGRFHIFPGSGLFKKGPRWLVAAEIVQTTRLYARMAAKVEPEWIEALSGHVAKRSYSDGHWSKESGQVMAFEKVSLFGLDIVPRRRVAYGPVAPAEARALFIHHALVEGEIERPPAFLEHNLGLIEEVKRLEAKARKRDILADTKLISDFYDARIPPEVWSTDTLNRWLKAAGRDSPRALRMTRSDLLSREAAEVTPERFPDAVPVAGTRLHLDYVLDPGGPTDGITITVPIEALIAFDEAKAEWLVPGLLKDKILALFRCLPKQYRKALDPAPQLAERIAAAIPFGQGDLYDALAARVKELKDVAIPREGWQPRGVPDHLRLNLRVTDERGKVLGESRDVTELKQRFAAKAKASFGKLARSGGSFDRDGLTDWDFGDLPERVDLDRAGLKLVGYPAVLDHGQTVSLRLLDSADAAATATHAGVRRLFALRAKDELLYQVRLVPDLPQMSLHYAPYGGGEKLKSELSDLAAERAFQSDGPVRTHGEFKRRLDQGWNRIGPSVREAAALVSRVLASRHAIAIRLGDRPPPAWAATAADIREQLLFLLPKGFIGSTPYEQLRHLPRYLDAIVRRLEKLQNAGLARDARWMAEVAPQWRRYLDRARQNGAHRPADSALTAYRWMLEEFRVSIFAQELGTATPVSARRLDEQWARVEAGA
jgi:ATP-dependent helicase HrpA